MRVSGRFPDRSGPNQFFPTLINGKEINHLLHLIIAVVTCLLWVPVWIALWIINKPKRLVIQIDDYGNVLRQIA
jgi:hypothetical protein